MEFSIVNIGLVLICSIVAFFLVYTCARLVSAAIYRSKGEYHKKYHNRKTGD